MVHAAPDQHSDAHYGKGLAPKLQADRILLSISERIGAFRPQPLPDAQPTWLGIRLSPLTIRLR